MRNTFRKRFSPAGPPTGSGPVVCHDSSQACRWRRVFPGRGVSPASHYHPFDVSVASCFSFLRIGSTPDNPPLSFGISTRTDATPFLPKILYKVLLEQRDSVLPGKGSDQGVEFRKTPSGRRHPTGHVFPRVAVGHPAGPGLQVPARPEVAEELGPHPVEQVA